MSLLRNFILFAIWLGVILYLSFAPLTNWPKETFLQKLHFDKIVHLTMYSVLCFLLLRSFFKQQNNHLPRYSVIIACVLFCIVVGTSIEILQPALTFFRQFDAYDIMANSAGVLIGYLVFSFLLKKKWLGMKTRMVN
jgi:glycopeptide antibiotics resistance protein